MLCVIRYKTQAMEPRAEEEETGVNSLDSPDLPARARNFRSTDLLADLELPAVDDFDQPRRANSRVSPDPVPDLPVPGTSGLPGPSGPRMPAHLHRANSLVRPDPPRNFRPCLRAATWAEARVPFRHLDYIYSIPYNFLGLAKL